jgi:hypothetical protein
MTVVKNSIYSNGDLRDYPGILCWWAKHKIQGALRLGPGGPQWSRGNGFNRIETPSEAYPETYFADKLVLIYTLIKELIAL